MIRRGHFRRLKWLILILVAGFLAGCIPIINANFELDIGMGEKWSFTTTIIVPALVADAVAAELSSQFSSQGQSTPLGVDMSITTLPVDESGNVPIQLLAAGRGYDTLNELFGVEVISVKEGTYPRKLDFNLDLGVTGTQSSEFTLRGGKILSHNGFQTDNNTVRWVDYHGTMSATLEEPGWMDYILWIMLGLVCVGILFISTAIFFAVRLKRNPKRVTVSDPSFLVQQKYKTAATPLPPPKSIPPIFNGEKLCAHCRSNIPGHSVFCPKCGTRQQ